MKRIVNSLLILPLCLSTVSFAAVFQHVSELSATSYDFIIVGGQCYVGTLPLAAVRLYIITTQEEQLELWLPTGYLKFPSIRSL